MRRTSRAALTLVEMLVAMAVSLIMMGAVVTIFGTMGNSITDSRAIMEISERLRNARNVMQRDFGNVTATMLPPRRPEMDEGYFEYIEGPRTDFWPNAEWPNQPSPPNNGDVATYFTPPDGPPSAARSMAGDTDDLVLFTARSRGEPYVGTTSSGSGQSLTAEVIYFTAVAPNTPTIIDSQSGASFQLRTLYRRVLLVNPAVGTFAYNGESLVSYRGKYDLSIRDNGTQFVSNGLGDLTKRENRYGHDPATFPFVANQGAALAGDRAGDDVLLTNVLAFDVRAYDPNVPVRMTATTNIATLPSDPGYGITGNSLGGSGGYVDLFYNRYINPAAQGNSYFSSQGNSLYSGTLLPTYDTWSMHYEQNGIDEFGDSTSDIATNGLDDNNNGVVDDPTEQEAPPPYPFPLRGIQIKIRVYEPDSRQIREVTVVQDFMPQ